jgi:hypothetical protein
MLYGDLSFRDRLARAVIGAVLGAVVGALMVFSWDMRSWWVLHQGPTFLLPGALVGGVVGAIWAFRRKRIV